MVEFVTTDLRDGYIFSKSVVFPDVVPIRAMVNGKKVEVGEGHLDPETGIFTGRFHTNNTHAQLVMDRMGNNVNALAVSSIEGIELHHAPVNMKLHSIGLVAEEPNPAYGVHPIEKIELLPNGNAIVTEGPPPTAP